MGFLSVRECPGMFLYQPRRRADVIRFAKVTEIYVSCAAIITAFLVGGKGNARITWGFVLNLSRADAKFNHRLKPLGAIRVNADLGGGVLGTVTSTFDMPNCSPMLPGAYSGFWSSNKCTSSIPFQQ